jgi:hypothetical protein
MSYDQNNVGKEQQTVGISGQEAASHYGFVDPLSAAANMSESLYGANGAVSSGPMGVYNQNANGVMSQVAGLSGPLEQTLSGIASRMSNRALDTTASNFANTGALGSGAGAAAMGEAMASPFASAQAQLQGSQLNAASGALQQLLGVSSNAYTSGLGAATGLMENTSGTVAPQYMTNPRYAAQQQGKQALLGGLGSAGPGLTTMLATGA